MSEHRTPNTEHRTPTLAMRAISKSFGRQRALEAVDLTVHAGEIHGLLGENGAGKTTLMNILAGLVRPDAGSVTVDGRSLRPGSPRDSAALGIGLVHQHFSLVPALTVAENLSLAAGSGPLFFRRSADLAGAALGIAERLGWRFDPRTPVWQLPVGHQQRLEILKVLQRDAQWLLFDEPTAVLSPLESEELFQVLERLRNEGRGIVFISHKLREVVRLSDRVTVLRRGRPVGERPRGATAAELGLLMVGEAATPAPAPCPPPPMLGEGELRSGLAGDSPSWGARSPEQAHGLSSPSPSIGGGRQGVGAGPALVVRELHVQDDRGLEAVRALSFAVQGGEIFGIAGVDGNGQAELAEAIVGLRRARRGSVVFPAAGSPALGEERAGYIPGDRRRSGLVLPMSVRENLVLEIHDAPRYRWGPVLRPTRLWTTAREMARQFDVRVADERQPASTLSGGNQQKIVVARALSGERLLLVTVNPTRGLDIGATGFVHAQLRAARSAGVGVLLISTDLDEVLDLSDRVGIMFEGCIQGIVSPTASRERIGQMMGGVGGGAAEGVDAASQT